MRIRGMFAGRLGRSGLVLILMGAALLGVQAQPDKPKEPDQKPAASDENVVTADKVKALQAQYESERAAADKAGLTKLFSPECYEKADALAKQGDTALSANHLATAVTRFRAALRQLPSLPPNLPPHITRIFGDGRWRHAFTVNAVTFSPDGKYLASGGEDGMIKVFDPATARIVACFSAHDVANPNDDHGGVRALAFSPDSTILASAGKGDVKLWRPKTGKEIKTLKGNTDLLDCVAFSPDGKTLAAGGKEKKLFLWNTASGELKADLQGHNALIRAVAFSRDGKKLASVSEDGILRTYDLNKPGEKPFDLVSISHFKGANAVAFDLDGLNVYVGGYEPNAVKLISVSDGSERRIFEGFPKEYGVSCMALSKDGRTLATSYGKQNIRLWDTASGQSFRTLTGHNSDVRSLAFSPDGLYLASGSTDQSVRLWALGAGEQHRSLAGHQGIVWSSSFSPDGKRMVTAGADRIVRIWDTHTDKELLALKGHKAAVTEARFSPDGKYILSCGGDKVMRLWNADNGSEVRVFEGHTAPVTSAAFSPDGKQIVSGSADRTARIWDTETGRVLHTLIGHRAVVSSVAWSRDGKHIATGSADHTARLWNAEGKPERVLKERPHTGAVSAVAFSPDSRWLATCGGDHLIKLWNVEKPDNPPEDFIGHEAAVSSVAFSPDSKVLASAGADEVVKLWDVATHSELQGFRGHTNWISSVAFSPDGHFLTSAGVDTMIKVWELSGRDSSAVDSRDAELRALAVSPDGKLLAGCGGPVKEEKGDNIIRVWELATGRELQALIGHQEPVWALAFLPDSKTLVSVGNDKQVRVWDATTGKEQRSIELPDRENVNEVPVLTALPDGKQLQLWLAPTQVAVLDVVAGKRELLASLVDSNGSENVSSLNFSSDGTLAVFGDKNGVARVWDKASGKLLGDPLNSQPMTEITDLILTPDKKTLVTGDKEGQVRIWSLAERKEPLHSFKAHGKYVYAFAMAPDGKRFATIGEDNIIKLWDVKTAKELRRWDLKRPAVNNRPFCRTLVFTPDGKGLVTANADTTAYMLDCTDLKAKRE